jgi:PAS domain S-box-containing protein
VGVWRCRVERGSAVGWEIIDLVKLLIEPETGCFLDASEAALGFYGYSREELQHLSAWDVTPWRSLEETLALLAEIAAGLDLSVRPNSQHRLHNGERCAVMVYPDLVEVDGQVLILAIVTVVTERQETETQRRETEQRWKRALEGAGHGVWDWHIPTELAGPRGCARDTAAAAELGHRPHRRGPAGPSRSGRVS